jgi:hypothetical protein
LLSFSAAASAETNDAMLVDRSRGESLRRAVYLARPNSVLNLSGTCRGPVTITTDGLQFYGRETASLDGRLPPGARTCESCRMLKASRSPSSNRSHRLVKILDKQIIC